MILRILCTLMLLQVAATGAPLSLEHQARSILADSCFECHGPDEEGRKADLRLDTFEGFTRSIDGVQSIVPGNPKQSEILHRIRSSDPDEVMPPAKAHGPLNQQQVAILEAWITAGAKVEPHWAFSSPVMPTVPKTGHPIDVMIDAKLKELGMDANPPADPYTQIRRLYLDLIGLPPSIEEVDAYVAEPSEAAWKETIENLLASPRYGERWGRRWLDLARYADTNGYEKDRGRTIWPYRDWVIRAINEDMPYDQFTVEQLAGDMLPTPSLDQRIATGFHRNTMLNEEGGIDPLEYRFYAMVDRVNTTSSIWLGLTVGCAQCHTHKYDPIVHDDYYSLLALLNNTDEPDLHLADQPFRQRLTNYENDLAKVLTELEAQVSETELAAWSSQAASSAAVWQVVQPHSMTSSLPSLVLEPDGSVFASGDFTKRDTYGLGMRIHEDQLPIHAIRLEVLPDDRLPAGGPGRAFYEGRKGDFFLSELDASFNGKDVPLHQPSASYSKISVGGGGAAPSNVLDGEGSSGWSTSGQHGKANNLVLRLETPITQTGELTINLLFERHFVTALGRFRLSVSSKTNAVAHVWDSETEARLGHGHMANKLDYIRFAQAGEPLRKRLETQEKKRPNPQTSMVMSEWPTGKTRTTHLHHRGEYLSPKHVVQPRVPLLFPQMKGPANRLSLAHWLTSKDNPLAARVAVNRAWQAFFGTGLVKTLDDFGIQGEMPTHPELLDWLALTFEADGWSRKALHRRIVSSQAYRRSADGSPEQRTRDPDNRWLARGPRFRVEAELIRDIMLTATGLRSDKMGGPGVRPPQPNSVTELAYGGAKWTASEGEDRHRRSVYTYIKRTAPFAATLTFDGPSGESCLGRRERSNTPLQALTLLNDEMFVEMARAIGERLAKAEDRSIEERITELFRAFISRPPRSDESEKLLAFYHAQSNASDAPWMLLARAIMNLDETITKP